MLTYGARTLTNVDLPALSSLFAISAGGPAYYYDGSYSESPLHRYFCGINTGEGHIRCWNLFLDPVTVGEFEGIDGEFRSVSAGNMHVCGITTDEAVQCTGDNTYGQAVPPDGLGD